jgi:NTE family protein
MSVFGRVMAAGLLLAVAGCTSVVNTPINVPTADPRAGLADALENDDAFSDDLLVGFAFSGGGTRAAAFSFGVLQALANAPLPGKRGYVIDHVDIISGVSGGSITAAYFGLKQRAALDDFRERFLLRDAEAALRTQLSIANLARGLGGGVNDDIGFRNWLDANLFEGATFGTLLSKKRPVVWINATDIYNRTPFVFGPETFSLLCSDIATYPVSSAVAASAAVPVAFAPVVLESYPERCNARVPGWVTRSLANVDAQPMQRALAEGMSRYRDGTVKYIKLLDGGLVDNYGLSSFTIARESATEPYGPLTRSQAMKVRRVLFIVVDAGLGPQGDWSRTLEGPTGAALLSAVTDVVLDSSKRSSYTAFEKTMQDWRSSLTRWRCRAGGGAGCGTLRLHIGRVAFDDLGPARSAALNAVPTNFNLPQPTVDMLIEAGRDAMTNSRPFREFLGGR